RVRPDELGPAHGSRARGLRRRRGAREAREREVLPRDRLLVPREAREIVRERTQAPALDVGEQLVREVEQDGGGVVGILHASRFEGSEASGSLGSPPVLRAGRFRFYPTAPRSS